MLIDVYDFDGTIYDGDSTVDFVRFCLARHPAGLLALPRVSYAALGVVTKRHGLTEFKSALFYEIARRFSLTEEARAFWDRQQTRDKLGAWFRETPRDLPIVIASASPEFELRYAAELLGVGTLIGTRCEDETGRLIGKNCKGEEKLRRIAEAVGPFAIRAMYTDDAKADGPLLACAREGYIVTHGKVSRYHTEGEG